MSRLDQVLQEHLRRDGNDECCIIRAARNVWVGVDDLLDSRNCPISRLGLEVVRARGPIERTRERNRSSHLLGWSDRSVVVRHFLLVEGKVISLLEFCRDS